MWLQNRFPSKMKKEKKMSAIIHPSFILKTWIVCESNVCEVRTDVWMEFFVAGQVFEQTHRDPPHFPLLLLEHLLYLLQAVLSQHDDVGDSL